MQLERSTLTLITVLAAVGGLWSAWSSTSAGHDPLVVGACVYGLIACGLGRLFGGSALGVGARSALLLAGAVLGVLASLFLGRAAGIRLTPTTT